MKAHIGVDAETGLVHRMTTTAANVHDVTEARRLLHGGETRVWGDAGYIRSTETGGEPRFSGGVAGGAEAWAAAEAGTGEPGSIDGAGQSLHKGQEPALAKAGVRYRGLAKNTRRLAFLLGLSNLLTAQSRLAR